MLAVGVVVMVLTQVLRRQELAYLGVFLLAVPALSLLWVALRRPSLTVRRRFSPESGSVGQAVTATVFVQNWGTLPTPETVWVDGATAPLEPSSPALLGHLPGFASSVLDAPVPSLLRYQVDTSRRGAHQVGPFALTVADPFGCAVRELRFGGTDTLLVTPTVFELARVDLRLSTGDGAEQVSRRLVGAGEQDVIARKYLPGDSIRRVHWPATAKHGEMMVRQDDQRNDQDAVIVLDARSFAAGDDALGLGFRSAEAESGSEGGTDTESDPAFEWAVSAVASIAVHLMNEGFGVRVVGHSAHGSAESDGTALTAPFGAARIVRDLAFATRNALGDAGEFRAAVDDAALTSPDAPPLFALVSSAPGAAARIRDLAAMSSHPVAFVVDTDAGTSSGRRQGGGRRLTRTEGAGAGAQELRAVGWNVVECTAAERLPVLWKALGESRGIA